MNTQTITILAIVAALLVPKATPPPQGKAPSSCTVEYENHNQIDYGPLIVQDVKGTVKDPQQAAMPTVCLGVFTEEGHKLVAVTESDPTGAFSLQGVPPGRYRLIAKAEPLCAANIPLRVVKRVTKKQVLLVHMKPRGLDTCSYGETISSGNP